jgi:pimeloyl-ACP methyl ester carboxylesterase
MKIATDILKDEKSELYFKTKGVGKTVLFIHGSVSDLRTFDYQYEEFANHFRTFSLSRQFYYPDKFVENGDTSINANIEKLNQFCVSQNLKELNLVGHSYGAFVTLAFAMKYKEKVKSITLVEPMIGKVLIRNIPSFIKLMLMNFTIFKEFIENGKNNIAPTIKALKSKDFHRAQTKFADSLFGQSVDLNSISEIIRQPLKDNIEILQSEINVWNNPFDIKTLKYFKVPTLLIIGQNSQSFMKLISKRLNQRIANSTLVEIEKSKHFVQVDNPYVFNLKVIKFINDN